MLHDSNEEIKPEEPEEYEVTDFVREGNRSNN